MSKVVNFPLVAKRRKPSGKSHFGATLFIHIRDTSLIAHLAPHRRNPAQAERTGKSRR